MKSNPIIDLQKRHVSIRSFTDEAVSDELLQSILEAGRRAPTSSNMQAYSIIVVKDPAVKKQMAVLAGNQRHIETCPVFLVFCADLNRLEKTCALQNKKMTNNLETLLIATIDASLVGMSVQTASESCGLGGVMIGALRNDPQAVADLLALPSKVYAVFGMCVGWPQESDIPFQKPRLPQDMVIHKELYNSNDPNAGIKAYDAILATHYASQKRNAHPDAWSGPLSHNLSRSLRPELRATLEMMGFCLL